MAIKTLLPNTSYVCKADEVIDEVYIDGFVATITAKTKGSNGTEVVDLATDGIYNGTEAKAVDVGGPVVFGPFTAIINSSTSASNIRLNIN